MRDRISTAYGSFSSIHKVAPLKELCKKGGIQTGPFGSQLHQKDYTEQGIPIITVEHLGENRIVHENTPFVSEKDYERLKKYSLKRGDIVFSRVGSVDRRALVREEEEGWLFSGRCLRVRPDNSLIDSMYLSYFFGLNSFRRYVRNIAVGATMPSLNTKILSNIPIVYPPLPTQKKIARILSSFDDKIELNRQMNRTLEAMAQAIFKSWFVDFDPVHAKAAAKNDADLDTAAKKLGISREILDLFPDKLVESEMGLVPEGWEVKALSEIITIKGGGTPKRSVKEYWGGDILWFSVKDTPSEGDVFVIDTQEKITTKGLEKSSAKLLKEGSTIITARGTVGNLALTAVPMSMNQSCYAIKARNLGDYYIYFLMQSIVDDLKRKTHGAVFDTITTKTFDAISIVEPEKEVAISFNENVKPLLQQLKNNLYEIQTLQKIRDTLLPKLLSGELDVSSLNNEEQECL